MLKDAMRSISARLRNCSKTGVEASLKAGKIWRCFSKLISNSCDFSEAEDKSSIRHGAGRHHPCVRCIVRFEDMVQGRKSSNRLLSATTDKRRRVENLKETVRIKKRSQKRRRCWTLKDVSNLSSKKSLAEWPSFSEVMCRETDLMMEDVYLVFTFEPLQDLHLRVFKLLQDCLIH